MKPPVVATFLAMEEGNDLQSPIPGNQILRTSLIQIRGPQPPAGKQAAWLPIRDLRLIQPGWVAPGVELRKAWRDGTMQLLLEPLELLEKLAALTPRPEVRLLLYHAGPARRLASASGGSRRLPGTDKGVYVSYEPAPF